jgi:hypothetical protein
MSIDKFAGVYTLTCDNCGEEFPLQFDDFYEAVKAKKEYGWRSKKVDGNREDWCDECCEEG